MLMSCGQMQLCDNNEGRSLFRCVPSLGHTFFILRGGRMNYDVWINKAITKESFIRKLYEKLQELVLSAATLISPTLNTKLRYYIVFKKKLNLKSPQSFHEKLLWLKLKKYIHNPLVIKCADKYQARNYVAECGYKDILVDMIGAWDFAKEIPWEELPNRFVLKWNFGAGMNIVCRDKDSLDKAQVIKQMNQWQKSRCWLSHSEMQYKYAPKKIICEKYLEHPVEATIPDYKIYCFHGKPEAIIVMHNRGSSDFSVEWFNSNWEQLDNSGKYDTYLKATQKPACLEKMLQAASALSSPFPFVRCDFYVVGEKFYFGELTFTPAAGLHAFTTKINEKEMTDFLNVP